MVRTIMIRCPHCHNKSELLLSMNPTIIVLNCPECWTPLLLDKSGVRTVSRQEIKEMVEHTGRSHKMESGAQSEIPEYMEAFHKKYSMFGTSSEVAVPSIEPGRMVFRDSITMDDVLDLRIELERCMDVGQFINRL